jgi:hypothetical protein
MSGQPQQNSLSEPVKQPEATTSHEERARADEMGLATLGLTMKYRGHERTTELPLTQDMIMQLVFEAHSGTSALVSLLVKPPSDHEKGYFSTLARAKLQAIIDFTRRYLPFKFAATPGRGCRANADLYRMA